MANHYTLFSEGIGDLTEEERAWCHARLKHLEATLPTLDHDGMDEDGSPCAPEDKAYVNGSQWLGFQWAIKPDGGAHFLWMYAQESGDVEQVALFAREFLVRFRPQSCFSLTWAATCSKPRIGEFSGGAVVVTADEMTWNSASYWAGQKIADFERKVQGGGQAAPPPVPQAEQTPEPGHHHE
jgi:hypothetical protein